MQLTWLGHSGFRLQTDAAVVLIDPWFTGNPALGDGTAEGTAAQSEAEAVAGVTHILLSHAHGDHAGDALRLSKDHDAPIVGMYDLMSHWAAREQVETIGFNKGGTVSLGDLSVTMVHATHSSSLAGPDGPLQAGAEAGYMLSAQGKTLYFAGDTDVMADMAVFEALHAPQIGILPIGGHFTMDGARAAFAARTYFNFSTLIPCHYKTFPFLAQDAAALKAGLPDPQIVREMDVMETITL